MSKSADKMYVEGVPCQQKYEEAWLYCDFVRQQ